MPAARGAWQPKSGGGGDPPIRLSDYPTLREQPVADAAVPRMELVEWAERYGVVAGVSTRGGGFSLGLWREERLGEHTAVLQSLAYLLCRLLLVKKKKFDKTSPEVPRCSR